MKYKKIILKVLDHSLRDCSSFASPVFILFILVFLLVTEFKLGLFFALGAFLVEIVGYSIKLLFPTTRPDKQKYSNILEKADAGSFPSIHSARIIFTGGFLLNVWNHTILIALLVLAVLLVGASRIYFKRHYLRDVIAGYVLGALVYVIILKLFL